MLNGTSEVLDTMSVVIQIESIMGNTKVTVEAHTTDRVTGNLETVNWNECTQKYSHLKGIEFPFIKDRNSVDLLIGLDCLELHAAIFEVRGQPGQPVARLTPLGWTCVGQILSNGSSDQTFFVKDQELNTALRKFWEIEEVSTEKQPLYSESEQAALNQSEQSLRIVDDRYEIGFPWKESKDKLENNYEMARKRLENTEKRLNKNPEIRETYSKTINMYLEKGYINKIPGGKTDDSKSNWYLPHFPVIKPDKLTTKVRLVFDASARYKDLSLNDVIHPGPKLQGDLFSILLRFRHHPVALVCDIQEMYLQIGILPTDRRYHRFLWRNSVCEEPSEYEFNRIVFGVNASPFLAQYVSQQNAKTYASEFPLASETVLNSTYMDDSLDSVLNDEIGIELYQQLSQLWQKAKMNARKWLSNSTIVLEKIPQENRAKEVDLSQGDLPSMKTLGLTWISESDIFTFKYNTVDVSTVITKRNFLQKIASLFDPLGFLIPFSVRAKKIMMQNMWADGLDWDEEITENMCIEVRNWFEEIQLLDSIKIERCITTPTTSENSLHTFVDASCNAIGAVIYIRNVDKNGAVTTKFVAAKSKVAPLKSVSVPRLELMAASLGLKLGQSVCTALNKEIKEMTFWSDSMNVLWWIRGPSRKYKTFVANRVGEIQSKTNKEQWRYIPTLANPADIASRGTKLSALIENELWWTGPNFLSNDYKFWPRVEFKPLEEAKVELKRKTLNSEICMTIVDSDIEKGTLENKLDPARYSSWLHLVRVYAWVSRFIDNCKLPKECRITKTELTVEEIQLAEHALISNAQRESFRTEYKSLVQGKEISVNSKLKVLNPILDEDGLMRSNSRLRYDKYLPHDTRFPIILPRKNWTTKLIVKHFHELQHHSGTNQTLSALSSRYWIIAGREEIREYEQECRECRRRKRKVGQQIMAPLPEFRTGGSRKAFSHVAVDFAGPFYTKQGRGKSRLKRYLCVFSCMKTRAIHLEPAFGLDTDSFMNAFYRFSSRRGLPEIVVSDNGSNFVGAVHELKGLLEHIDKDKVQRNAANRGVQWYFNPPGTPHFGGVHESMVKCAKRAIFAIFSNASVSDEELITAFVGAEGLINSRPLTYQSAHPEDSCVITPNHFLHGQVGGQFAPESVDSTNFNINKRWRFVQELVKHFWKRWLREFLPTLAVRKKWQHSHRNFQVGDVVLIVDPEVSRGHWNLGKVTDVHPGVDGHVRVVTVQTRDKLVKRPTTRLCLIEENPT